MPFLLVSGMQFLSEFSNNAEFQSLTPEQELDNRGITIEVIKEAFEAEVDVLGMFA